MRNGEGNHDCADPHGKRRNQDEIDLEGQREENEAFRAIPVDSGAVSLSATRSQHLLSNCACRFPARLPMSSPDRACAESQPAGTFRCPERCRPISCRRF